MPRTARFSSNILLLCISDPMPALGKLHRSVVGLSECLVRAVCDQDLAVWGLGLHQRHINPRMRVSRWVCG